MSSGKNKGISAIIILVLYVVTVSSKTPEGDIEWEKTFGRSSDDYGYSVQQTSDGGYIIAGSTNSGTRSSDLYLVKTDSKGSKLWEKTFGGCRDDYAYAVQQTSDRGYIIAGATNSGTRGSDLYLIKTDPDGGKLWAKAFGGSCDDYGYSVQQTTDNGYIIAGATNSGAGGSNVYLLKTDANGKKLWKKTFGGSSNDWGRSVQQTSDGGYIIAGYTYSYGAGESDVYLIKTNSKGGKLWEKTFGGCRYDYGYFVQQTSDGGYIIAGSTNSGAGRSHVYLIKTDSKGSGCWEKTFGGCGDDFRYCVQQTSDSGYIIAGSTNSGKGGSNVYLLKTNSDGEELWEKTFGGCRCDYGYSVQQTSDGGYIIAGSTKSGTRGSNIYLLKTNPGTRHP